MKQGQSESVNNTPSKLEQFSIGFEYDKTLNQLKAEMQQIRNRK